jgi:hypothetical protein
MRWKSDRCMVCDARGCEIGDTASAGDAASIAAAHNMELDRLRLLVDRLGDVPVEPRVTGVTVKDGRRVGIIELSEADSLRYDLWSQLKELIG